MFTEEKRDGEVEVNEVRQLLIQALFELERRGWCQNELHDLETGEVCMLGAIELAHRSSNLRLRTESKAYETLAGVVCTSDIAEWNDDEDRTYDQVVRAFQKAILVA